ncbi:hypothetical protein QYB82_000138 [Clostridium perfringens]|nr:hypothetical protein [Clostridium perfringens]
MIHTGEFFIILNINDEEDKKTIEMLNKIKVYSKGAFRIVCRKTKIGKYEVSRLHVYVDFIELLGKTDIVEGDVVDIIFRIRQAVECLICNNEFDLILSRLDYRYDVLIPDRNERELIIKLLKKSMASVNYMKKVRKYRDTVRYFSKSRSDNIYDKEIERLAKKKKIKPYEKDILRFEAQVKNEHIKYKNKKFKIDRSFEEYFTMKLYKFYMEKMLISVVGKGDFYSLREAEKIIAKSNIKDKEKNELREFLVYTSRKRNLSKTKKKYGRYKFSKNTNILRELGINSIIIPEKWRVKKINNPLKELIKEFNYEDSY